MSSNDGIFRNDVLLWLAGGVTSRVNPQCGLYNSIGWGLLPHRRGSVKTNAGAVVKLGPPQTYVFVKPNLTRAQAERFAQDKLKYISSYERTADIKMTGDLTTNVRDKVRLTGTGAFFNQRYYIDSLTRKISLKSGFIQTFTLKSRSSQTIIVS